MRFKGELGDLTLVDYLAHPKSRAQGFVVVHQGRIVSVDYLAELQKGGNPQA